MNPEVQRLADAIKRKLGEFEVTVCIAGMHKRTPFTLEAERNDLHKAIDRLAALAQPAPQVQEAKVSELRLLTDLRWAMGDFGKRMQPELVEYAHELKQSADEADRLRSLLSAAPASPPGWVLVPVEPTEEMLIAGRDAQNAAVYRRPQPTGTEYAAEYYRAMLAATPHPPGDTKP